VERAQELLVLLSRLKEAGRLPHIPIYLDSPMGVSATKVMQSYPEWHNLSRSECYALDEVADLIVDATTSRAIVANKDPKIIMAGSGMLTGGRVLHYLNNHIHDERNTILIVGYQAAGTRGRALVEGERELKFFGEYHQVKADVKKINTLSAHADQAELIRWLGNTKGQAPSQVFLNHGEPHQSNALRSKIEYELGWNCTVAQTDRIYTIISQNT
jgi:metallo-beta-lactamase family protein